VREVLQRGCQRVAINVRQSWGSPHTHRLCVLQAPFSVALRNKFQREAHREPTRFDGDSDYARRPSARPPNPRALAQARGSRSINAPACAQWVPTHGARFRQAALGNPAADFRSFPFLSFPPGREHCAECAESPDEMFFDAIERQELIASIMGTYGACPRAHTPAGAGLVASISGTAAAGLPAACRRPRHVALPPIATTAGGRWAVGPIGRAYRND
jgi:hypothetical protein